MSIDHIPALATFQIADPDRTAAPKGADEKGTSFYEVLRSDIGGKSAKTIPAPINPGADHDAKQRELLAKREQQATEASQTFDKILEVGFSDWAQEMRKEKLEAEIRQRVLDAMGITEEELSTMPAVQRQLVEQMILDEIQKQMQAINQLDESEKDDKDKNDGTVSVAMLPGSS